MKRALLFLMTVTMLSASRTLWATPFDGKLEEAGFNDSFRKMAGRSQSIESLFLTAKSFRYVPDSWKEDKWQSADETDARRSGDCEDKALWLYRELKRNGYENVHLAVGKYRPNDTALHAWVSYTDEAGKNIILDPTVQQKPWRAEDFSKGFYCARFSFDGALSGQRSISVSS